MARHSFIQMSKLPNVKGRISYITSHARQENLYARGQASQIAQNDRITDMIYNRLSQCPVNTIPVYGNNPIWSCTQNVANNGCGCNNGAFN